MLRGILIDLDDTLYPQREFLNQAWEKVAAFGESLGLDGRRLRSELRRAARDGTDGGRVIDHAVARAGADPATAAILVQEFAEFRPARLSPYPRVRLLLERLTSSVPVVVVTDGNPPQQRAKLAATGLGEFVSAMVCTDEIDGRASRKPHAAGFRAGLLALGCGVDEAAMIGDRPDKDIVGAAALGIRSILVRQGEYRHAAAVVPPWRCVKTVANALQLMLDLVDSRIAPCMS